MNTHKVYMHIQVWKFGELKLLFPGLTLTLMGYIYLQKLEQLPVGTHDIVTGKDDFHKHENRYDFIIPCRYSLRIINPSLWCSIKTTTFLSMVLGASIMIKLADLA